MYICSTLVDTSTIVMVLTLRASFNLNISPLPADHDQSRFYSVLLALISGTKCVFKHQDLQMFSLKLNKYV